MAQKVVVSLTSDLSGSEHSERTPVGTVGFGLDGTGYELELTESEQAGLRELFAPYIAAARRLGRAPTPPTASSRRGARARAATPARSDPEQAQAVRQWARRHGLTVSDRGRVPQHIQQAYQRNDPALATTGNQTSRADIATGTSAPRVQDSESQSAATQPAPSAASEASQAGEEPVGRDGLTRARREAIRSWAQVQGMDVKDRGILKKETIHAATTWENTHGTLEVAPAESSTP